MEVTYYDKSGRRVPAPRHDTVPSNGMAAGVAVALISALAIIALGVWAHMQTKALNLASQKVSEPPKTEHLITHDNMTAVHTYNGEVIRFYVMTDPDTGVEYIVNDRGGMCLRENPDAL